MNEFLLVLASTAITYFVFKKFLSDPKRDKNKTSESTAFQKKAIDLIAENKKSEKENPKK